MATAAAGTDTPPLPPAPAPTPLPAPDPASRSPAAPAQAPCDDVEAGPQKAVAPSCRRQHAAALLAHGWSACVGAATAWTSPALPVLMGHRVHTEDRSVTARVSLDEASWMAALFPLGALLAGPAAGALARSLGRRGALLALAPPTAAAWMLLAWAGHQALLVHAGRFFIGVSWGLSATLVPMYCSEIADKRCRGRLNAYFYPASVLGHVWVCVLGTFLPYLWYSAACGALPLLALAGLWWAPESPVHLAEIGRHEEAWSTIRWLRGGSPLVDPKPELEAVLAAVNALDEDRTRFAWKMLADPKIARALALCLGVQLFQLTCGVNAFVFYTTQIFEGVGIVPSGNVCSIVLTVTHFVAAVCSTRMLSRMPRRPFLFVSAIGMAIGQGGFGLYSYYYRYGYDVKAWAWTPTLSIGVFYIFHSMGFGPLPGVFMGEILPAQVKPWAIPTIAFFARTVASTLAKEVPIFIDVCRHHVVFGMFFGGFSALGAIFVFLFVPETILKSPASNKKSTDSDR